MERPENLSSNNNSLDSFNSSKYGEDEKAYENSQDLNEAPLLIISGEKETISNEVKETPTEEGFKEISKSSVSKWIADPVVAFKKILESNKETIYETFKIFLYLGVTVYMVIACVINFKRSHPLFIIWFCVVVYKVFLLINRKFKENFQSCFNSAAGFASIHSLLIKRLFLAVVFLLFVLWIVFDTLQRPKQIVSAVGYFVFLFLLFITSRHPDKVNWRSVFLGCLLQITLAVIILRTEAGFSIFQRIGLFTQTFISYVESGASFVFGEAYFQHFFAFFVLSIVIYFSAFISIMYYLGAMQWLIFKIAWLMHITLKTSATESLVAAGNIFVGQTESPLLIRPYINDLTTSELHAVMTTGFGTIAGSVLGAYIGFGIEPVYIITACFMAAPCALAVSKLFYPETQKSKFSNSDGLVLEKPKESNVIEAAFVGASQAIPLVLNIAVNLIAFISILTAFNGFMSWFGSLVGYPQLSFEMICSYLFLPIAFLMGIDWVYCFKAAELLGIKVFLNEFIAYQSLSELIKLRDSGIVPQSDPGTGNINWLDERTEAIVTYAICGFANFSSLGIQLGGLGSMAPEKIGEISRIALRALVAGVFVGILNACVAGFFYVPRPIVCDNILSNINWTYTEPSRLFACCSGVLEADLLNSTLACRCCNNYLWNQTNFSLNCNSLRCN